MTYFKKRDNSDHNFHVSWINKITFYYCSFKSYFVFQMMRAYENNNAYSKRYEE